MGNSFFLRIFKLYLAIPIIFTGLFFIDKKRNLNSN